MFKIIRKVVSRIIISIFLLYGLDLLVSNLNVIIPINAITVGLTSILGIPGLCAIIGLYFVL